MKRLGILAVVLALGFQGIGQVQTDTVYLNDVPCMSGELRPGIGVGRETHRLMKTNPDALREYHKSKALHSVFVAFMLPTGILVACITPYALTYAWSDVTSEGWVGLGCIAGAALVTLPVAVVALNGSEKHLERARELYNDGVRHKSGDHIMFTAGPTRYGVGITVKF